MPADTVDFDQDTPPEPMPRQEQPAQPVPGNITPAQAEPSVEDIDPNEALTEAQEADRPAPAAAASNAEPEDIVDVLEPKAGAKEWSFGPAEMPLTYIQKPLSFIGKMQWFSLVGDVLDRAMSGPNGISINEVLETPGMGRGGSLTIADFRDADTFVRAIGKLVVYAPDFIVKSYCIWLGVPEHQKALVAEVMALPEEEGGLSDDQGIEMIEVFIDQNYDALADFFGGKFLKLQRRVTQRGEERKARNVRA